MKIPARFAPVAFGALLSTVMVSLVTAVLLLRREGPGPQFAAHWLQGFAATWPAAFPAALVVAPLVRRVVDRLTAAPEAPAAPLPRSR